MAYIGFMSERSIQKAVRAAGEQAQQPPQPGAVGGYAVYATHPEASRGRLTAEPESPSRTVFQRDRDRVLHSGAFRRLMHKTQVFVAHVGDYYRTRLTHSLEVAQIARSVCRELGLNEDLAETLSLCHDLGHTPFGHAGEEALHAAMTAHGGFDHNAQSLRLVTYLEQRYADFDGLNLTWETLEGLVKHNGPLLGADSGTSLADLPYAIRVYSATHDLELSSHAGPEAQIAALADDIAYNNHDIDDGFRAGLFSVEDLLEVPMVGEIFKSVMDSQPGLDDRRLRHESIRRLISLMVSDLVGETTRRLAQTRPESAADIRALETPIAGFSQNMAAHHLALKEFLRQRMYCHHRVNRSMSKARRVVTDLFELFYAEPGLLPQEWQVLCGAPRSDDTARVICDYIAGMTDRFAMEEHKHLFDLSSERT